MTDNYVLTEEQVKKLNNGEPVELESNHMRNKAVLNPPCSDSGHDWSHYNVHKGTRPEGKPSNDPDDKARWLTRKCTKCGESQSVSIPVEMLFRLDEPNDNLLGQFPDELPESWSVDRSWMESVKKEVTEK